MHGKEYGFPKPPFLSSDIHFLDDNKILYCIVYYDVCQCARLLLFSREVRMHETCIRYGHVLLLVIILHNKEEHVTVPDTSFTHARFT